MVNLMTVLGCVLSWATLLFFLYTMGDFQLNSLSLLSIAPVVVNTAPSTVSPEKYYEKPDKERLEIFSDNEGLTGVYQ
jgi:hypothetical protein